MQWGGLQALDVAHMGPICPLQGVSNPLILMGWARGPRVLPIHSGTSPGLEDRPRRAVPAGC